MKGFTPVVHHKKAQYFKTRAAQAAETRESAAQEGIKERVGIRESAWLRTS